MIIFHLCCCCSSNISSFTHCQNKKKHLLLQNFLQKKNCKKRKEMLIKFKVKKNLSRLLMHYLLQNKNKQKSNTCGIKIVFAHTFDITEMKKITTTKNFFYHEKNKILISVKLSNIVSHFCTFSINNNNNTIDQSSIFV